MFAKSACCRPSYMLQRPKERGKWGVFATGSETVVHGRMAGAPGRIRTHDPQIRSLVLYPAELPVRSGPPNLVTREPIGKRGYFRQH